MANGDTATLALKDELVALSRALGRPGRELAILGEGNVSALCGDGSFWVKASGAQLGSLSAAGLSRVRLETVLELSQREAMGEKAIEQALVEATLDGGKKPSVETFMHALCLQGGARWVGHTHPVAVNAVLCSRLGATPFLQHIFPDAVVVCGPKPAVVPYVDPGFALAKAVARELERFGLTHGQAPKLLLLVNHGLVALGESAKEVMNITLMADKWARILLGAYALGGPAFLPADEVARIDGRLDEAYRRRALREEG